MTWERGFTAMTIRHYPNSLPADLRASYPYPYPYPVPQLAGVVADAPPALPMWALPMLEEEAIPAACKKPVSHEGNGTRTRVRPQVLVVDDEIFNVDLIASAFEEEYEILSASSGEEALRVAKRHLPDLILLDVMMPRMDGFDVCTRLKADDATRNIPVIFITGLGDTSLETVGLELGAMDFISKPINPAAVRARVSNQINLKIALEQLAAKATMEQSLRQDVLDALVLNSQGRQIH
jgi:PleD family two-component response regulator